MYPNITVWLNIFALFIYHILCTLVSVNEHLAPICLLWAMLLWTLAFPYLHESLFSVILGIYQDVVFYITMIMYLYVLGTLEMWPQYFIFPQATHREFNFWTSWSTLFAFHFWKVTSYPSRLLVWYTIK